MTWRESCSGPQFGTARDSRPIFPPRYCDEGATRSTTLIDGYLLTTPAAPISAGNAANRLLQPTDVDPVTLGREVYGDSLGTLATAVDDLVYETLARTHPLYDQIPLYEGMSDPLLSTIFSINESVIAITGGQAERVLFPSTSSSTAFEMGSLERSEYTTAAERRFCRRHIRTCKTVFDSAPFARTSMLLRFKAGELAQDTQADAYQHCVWMGRASMSASDNLVREYGEAHEARGPLPTESAQQQRVRKIMDLFNNGQGISFGNQAGDNLKLSSQNRLVNLCYNAARNGTLYTLCPRNFASSNSSAGFRRRARAQDHRRCDYSD